MLWEEKLMGHPLAEVNIAQHMVSLPRSLTSWYGAAAAQPYDERTLTPLCEAFALSR